MASRTRQPDPAAPHTVPADRIATTPATRRGGALLDRVMASKVPQVTLVFWVVKILTTGAGETMSDFFAQTIGPVPAVLGSGVALMVALAFQLRADRYSPWTYWIAVLLVSVFGTVAADVVHVALGVPYEISTPFFAVVLAAVLMAWRRVEGTLSIHSIRTTRRELFYWATVLTTFALGTAAGDLSAKDTDLGYLGSGLLFAAIFAIPAVLWLVTQRHEVALFWWAYVMTRPFGASFADWMGVPAERGGLGWGTGWVTLALLVLIGAFVTYLARTHHDEPLPDQPLPSTD